MVWKEREFEVDYSPYAYNTEHAMHTAHAHTFRDGRTPGMYYMPKGAIWAYIKAIKNIIYSNSVLCPVTVNEVSSPFLDDDCD